MILPSLYVSFTLVLHTKLDVHIVIVCGRHKRYSHEKLNLEGNHFKIRSTVCILASPIVLLQN